MMKSNLSMLAIASALLASTEDLFTSNKPTNSLKPSDISGKVFSVIPAGCKEYFFDNDGEFSTEKMRYSELAFKCIASNDKTAIKKFNKWKVLKQETGALAD